MRERDLENDSENARETDREVDVIEIRREADSEIPIEIGIKKLVSVVRSIVR